MTEFQKELAALINRHGLENNSDTPDFILAAYLTECLRTFSVVVKWRSDWYSPEGVTKSTPKVGVPAPRAGEPSK